MNWPLTLNRISSQVSILLFLLFILLHFNVWEAVLSNMRQYSLSGLFTFEVAARHLSFTKAAEELHITQGAVSQQIRQLEDRLGFPLFERQHRRLALTSMGARLAVQLHHSFSEIGTLIESLKQEQRSDILTVSVMPSFATKWLIPRLGGLKQVYPDLQLRIQANEREVNFRRDRIDVAIVHSHIHSGDYYQVPLIKDKVFPVCSPVFAELHQLRSPEQLRGLPLLNDDSEWRFTSPYAEWEQWLALAGVKGVNPGRGVSFNRGDLAIQAAMAGQGVALGRTPLVMDDIEAGRLIKPFNPELDRGLCYLFVCPEAQSQRPQVRRLLRWLVEECERYASAETLTSTEALP